MKWQQPQETLMKGNFNLTSENPPFFLLAITNSLFKRKTELYFFYLQKSPFSGRGTVRPRNLTRLDTPQKKAIYSKPESPLQTRKLTWILKPDGLEKVTGPFKHGQFLGPSMLDFRYLQPGRVTLQVGFSPTCPWLRILAP